MPGSIDPVQIAQHALDGDQRIDLEQVERALIEKALQKTQGNVSAAARLLTIGREALRYRMTKFNLTGAADSAEPGSGGAEDVLPPT